MKKALVAVEDENEYTGETKRRIERLAKSDKVEILGVLKYPRGFILENPEFFIAAMEKVNAEYAYVTSPEFIIHEIKTKGKLAAIAQSEHLKIIDATLEIDIAEVEKLVPKEVLADMTKLLNLKAEADKIMDKITSHDHSAMIITKDSSTSEFEKFADCVSGLGYQKLSVLEIDEYIPEMEEILHKVIKDQGIDKIFVVDDYPSKEFYRFLSKQEDNGVEVSYEAREEMKMDDGSKFYGMFMN